MSAYLQRLALSARAAGAEIRPLPNPTFGASDLRGEEPALETESVEIARAAPASHRQPVPPPGVIAAAPPRPPAAGEPAAPAMRAEPEEDGVRLPPKPRLRPTDENEALELRERAPPARVAVRKPTPGLPPETGPAAGRPPRGPISVPALPLTSSTGPESGVAAGRGRPPHPPEQAPPDAIRIRSSATDAGGPPEPGERAPRKAESFATVPARAAAAPRAEPARPPARVPVSAPWSSLRPLIAGDYGRPAAPRRPPQAPARAPAPQERAPDEIQIHIGRIEVVAAPPAPRPAAAPGRPKASSLDEYLRNRDRRAS